MGERHPASVPSMQRAVPTLMPSFLTTTPESVPAR